MQYTYEPALADSGARSRPHRLIGRIVVLGAMLASLLAVPAFMQSAAAASTLRELASAQDFKIGTALASDHLNNDAEYRQTAAAQFNSATAENAMKWAVTEPSRGQFDFSRADRVANFAAQHNMELRGHTLLWHTQLPSWVDGLSASELRQATYNHIDTVVNRYEDQIVGWDVVNEAFLSNGQRRQNVWQQKLGDDYIANMLRRAHQADPNAKLYLNDYGIDGINAKSDAYYQLAQSLLSRGVPLHGIGLEAHLIAGSVPGDIEQNIRRFVQLGLEVRITELDIRIDLPASQQELQQQAQDYRQVMNACLSVDGCVGVTVWQFTDKYSWIPNWSDGEQGAATPYDENIEPKPAYYAMREALGGQGDGGDDGDNGEDPPGQSGPCAVNYQVSNQWGSGFTAKVTVTNNGGSVQSWTMEWDFTAGQQITNGWKGNFSQSGSHVTVTSKSWNGSLGGGESVSIGFNGSYSGSNPEPENFTLNGTACSS